MMESPALLWAALVGTFCALLNCALPALATDGGFELKSFRWAGPLESDRNVMVRNPFGDVRVRNTEELTLGVSAMIQKLSAEQGDPRIEAEAVKGGYRVDVRASFESAHDGRVDLTVLVPPETSVEAQTTFGAVYMRLRGDVMVRTEDGRQSIDATGHVDLGSRSGSIELWLGGRRWSRPLRVRSVTGGIVAKMGGGANLTVHASTQGRLELQDPGAEGSGVEVTTGQRTLLLGDGTGSLSLASESGEIVVRLDDRRASEPVAPTTATEPLKDLPRTEPWESGDPIQEVPSR